MKTGIHLIGDLQGCQFSPKLKTRSGVGELKQTITSKINEFGLHELGSYYYYFEPYGVTGVVCLSESHISFHTWAKGQYANLDVFVCNYKNDNTNKAHQLFEFLITNIFRPQKTKRQEIER